MFFKISNITRLDPQSKILYRLGYRCKVTGDREAEVFFVVELNPLGERRLYLDADKLPQNLDDRQQGEVLHLLQGIANEKQLPG